MKCQLIIQYKEVLAEQDSITYIITLFPRNCSFGIVLCIDRWANSWWLASHQQACHQLLQVCTHNYNLQNSCYLCVTHGPAHSKWQEQVLVGCVEVRTDGQRRLQSQGNSSWWRVCTAGDQRIRARMEIWASIGKIKSSGGWSHQRLELLGMSVHQRSGESRLPCWGLLCSWV